MEKKPFKWGQVLASLFLLYHLVAVLVLPNPGSYLDKHWGFLFYPYANTLGFHTPWQFFSPNPSRHVYFEYEIESAESDQAGRWPPLRSESDSLWPNYMRLIYHSRFTTSNPERKLYFLSRYLCQSVPGAERLHLKTLSEEIPTLERAALSPDRVMDEIEIREWSTESFECAEATGNLPELRGTDE